MNGMLLGKFTLWSTNTGATQLTTLSNSGIKGQKDMVRGQRLYVAGDGIGHPKDGMPVHVRLRQK